VIERQRSRRAGIVDAATRPQITRVVGDLAVRQRELGLNVEDAPAVSGRVTRDHAVDEPEYATVVDAATEPEGRIARFATLMIRFVSVTVGVETGLTIWKMRNSGSALRRRMTIRALGPVIESVLLIVRVPPPASGLASVIGPVRPGAKLISVLPGSLIASRSVHCVALQTPLRGSARLLTTLCPRVWLNSGPPGSAGDVGAVGR
jgi:hypothetical protein